jgi:HPt (histidine-containing phosphotransfer) domain-containing protein
MNLDPDSQPLEINWERLGQISDDDEEFQLELLSMLAADITEKLVIIQAAIEQQSGKQLQEIGHYLKGATANVGVVSISVISGQIEDHARTEQFELAASCLAALAAQQQKLLAYLAKKTG